MLILYMCEWAMKAFAIRFAKWRYDLAQLKVHFLVQSENTKTVMQFSNCPFYSIYYHIYWTVNCFAISMYKMEFSSFRLLILLYLIIFFVIFICILNIKLIEFADLLEFCNFVYIFDGHSLTKTTTQLSKQTNKQRITL